jgi:hypothetical protein
MASTLTAAQTVEALVKLGTLISDKKGATDWNTFVNSQDYKSIESVVLQTAQNFGKGAIQKTISSINEKQQTLLAQYNGSLVSLPTDKLLQYAALSNLRLKLQATQGYGGDIGIFGDWLVNDALPVILQVAPMVIPLLL